VHLQWPMAPGQLGRAPEQGQSRPTTRISGDLEVVPADGRGVGQRLERLEGRLLGRDPGSEMGSGLSHAADIGCFGIGQQLFHRPLAMTREQALDPWNIHQVDSDADDPSSPGAQKNSHHQATSGWSHSGAARYPPMTSPR